MKNTLQSLLVIAFISFVWTTAIAQESVTVQSAEMVDYGIYKIELTGDHVPVASTGAGAVQPAYRAVLVTTTNQIPSTIGNCFGFQFILHGTPDGALADVIIKVNHPAFRKPDGSVSGNSDAVPWRYRIGEKVGYTYTLDHDWEAVPGKWSIEIWRGKERLVGKEFVVKAADK